MAKRQPASYVEGAVRHQRAAEPSPPPRCAVCGTVLAISPFDAPRLRLFCRACRPRDRLEQDEHEVLLGEAPTGRRWPARRVLRLLLIGLALCVFLIRLLES